MKITLQLFSALVIAAFQFISSPEEKTTITPKMAVLEFEEDTLDYGTILQHSDGNRVFKFTNTGDAPLVIASVRPSCGCTVAHYTKEAILPGKQGEIKVKYDTKRLGGFNKSIRVQSNTENGTKLLRIRGTVVAKS